MVEIVEWGGRKWRRYPNSKRESDRRYFRRTTRDGESLPLHRAVWEHHKGPIPGGHHIHHRDGNTANNDIDNLACLPSGEHLVLHGAQWSDERLERQRIHLAAIRDKTKAWHASEAGRAKHREIGPLAYARFVPEPKRCEQCSRVFSPRKIGNVDRFCSNACKSAWRRQAGSDNEARSCAECGADFSVNRYSKTKTCSRSCGNRARARTMRDRV